MKNRIVILCIFSLFTAINISCSSAQNPTVQASQEFDDINIECIAARLFDSPIIELVNSDFRFIWQPNYAESLIFNVSYDNMCHTSVDTVIHFTNSSMEDGAIFIFKTQTYDSAMNVVGSHFSPASVSVAVFSKDSDNTWQLDAFKKHLTNSGLFGGDGKEGIGKFTILRIGEEVYLSLKRPIAGNNGYNQGREDLYYIEGELPCDMLQNVFNHSYYIEENVMPITASINVEKSSNMYLLIEENNGKSKRYYFDDGFNMFCLGK